MADARLLHGDIAHPLDDAFRAVKRCAVRKLGEADEILLVLRRYEPAWDRAEHAVGGSHQRHIDDHDEAFARYQPAYGFAVPVGGGPEGAVESTEEPAENPVHEAGQPVFRCVVLFQQQGRKSG